MIIKVKNNLNIILIAIAIFLSSFIFHGDADPRLTRLTEKLEFFTDEFPQKKVYLHLDKTVYRAGESIWYKAYLVNATNHAPDILHTNLYVELVNVRGELLRTQILHLKEGVAHGDIILLDTIPEGNYTIRAYVNWMNNFDPVYLFSKKIYIRNPENKNFISNQEIRFNRRFNRQINQKSTSYEIQFFPEGGNLLEGISNRVAFKALNSLGKGIDAIGIIVDGKGNEITNFKSYHLGMGAFEITPDANTRYFAKISFEGGKPARAPLPASINSGITLKINNLSPETVQFEILHNKQLSGDRFANDVFIIGQTRGIIYYINTINLKDDTLRVNIPGKTFPTGITQFTLFNWRGIPLAERLVFIDHDDLLNISIQSESTVKPSFPDTTELVIRVTDKDGNPVAGNFSMAITSSKTGPSNGKDNLANYLLLSSDIKGHIESPGHYFDKENPERSKALDYLMMTQGWRRFNWTDILAENYPEIRYQVEQGLTITGTITRELIKLPLPGAEVTLAILDEYNDFFETITDENGRFMFNNLYYSDTINAVLEAQRPTGRKNVIIALNYAQAGLNPDPIDFLSFNQQVTKKGDNWRYGNVKRIDYYEKEQKIARAKQKKAEPFKIYRDADNVIYMDDLPGSYNTMFQALQGRIPGVSITGNNVTIRGPGSFLLSTDPLFLIDGVVVDKAAFNSLNPGDVEFVEVLKGPSASIYGSRGANGVIAAYTKRGDFMIKGYLSFQMLGYYQPRDFYTPGFYGNLESELTTGHKKTIFWVPDLITDNSGQTKVLFNHPDNNPDLVINIQGVGKKGQVASKTYSFHGK